MKEHLYKIFLFFCVCLLNKTFASNNLVVYDNDTHHLFDFKVNLEFNKWNRNKFYTNFLLLPPPGHLHIKNPDWQSDDVDKKLEDMIHFTRFLSNDLLGINKEKLESLTSPFTQNDRLSRVSLDKKDEVKKSIQGSLLNVNEERFWEEKLNKISIEKNIDNFVTLIEIIGAINLISNDGTKLSLLKKSYEVKQKFSIQLIENNFLQFFDESFYDFSIALLLVSEHQEYFIETVTTSVLYYFIGQNEKSSFSWKKGIYLIRDGHKNALLLKLKKIVENKLDSLFDTTSVDEFQNIRAKICSSLNGQLKESCSRFWGNYLNGRLNRKEK